MSILDNIVADKIKEVASKKLLYPQAFLEKQLHYNAKTVSLKKYLLRKDKAGIIAEIKRKSPSKGVINPNVSVEKISLGYMQAGVSGLSILTDEKYFGGHLKDLEVGRKFNFCPILRKDFMIDEYQIHEARAFGADVILLIAAALTAAQCKSLAAVAKRLNLEVLLEVHHIEELRSHINQDVDMVGVNNRNLKTFDVNIKTSYDLLPHIPSDFLKVAESGISKPETVRELKEAGYHGFLMGERFMTSSNPELACLDFVKKLQKL